MPRRHLLRQLYMFSEALDPDEAFENISGLSHFFFTDDFVQGVKDLSAKLDLALDTVHVRRSSLHFQPRESDLQRLQSMVKPESDLYQRLRRAYKSMRRGSEP